jgi:hypothetical protein
MRNTSIPAIKDVVSADADQIHLHFAKQPQLSLIPTFISTYQRQKSPKRGISSGAGFAKRKENDISFEELLKTKALDARSQRILALNTAMNVSVKPTREAIDAINNRWESMMTTLDEQNMKKSKRNISFNEKVTCHKISRIKDILEEYDAFEKEFYEECEARFSDDTPGADEPTTHTDTFIDISIEDILEESDVQPLGHLSGQETIFEEARNRNRRRPKIICDSESVSSMGSACPTPERKESPGISDVISSM